MSKLFYIWQRIGIKAGWISPVICMTHDGGSQYMGQEWESEWEEGNDPCQFVYISLPDVLQ